ncbi:MAG TPA: hypothetical protein VK810_00065 [Dongiaceae bacterium]|jgi:hypothetical protein|nr:hypothetical protein [Dongiaceae bacterium]
MKKFLYAGILLIAIGGTLILANYSSVKNAREDYYALWMDASKGFNGPVYYIGSDATNDYFRVGSLIHNYYKIRVIDVHLPKTFPVSKGEPYLITADNSLPEYKPQK